MSNNSVSALQKTRRVSIKRRKFDAA